MEHSDFNNQIAKFEDSLEQERVEYNSEETSPNRTSSVESWDNLSGEFKIFKILISNLCAIHIKSRKNLKFQTMCAILSNKCETKD